MVWQAWAYSAVTAGAIVSGIAAASWTALRLARRLAIRTQPAEPACARCGYIVHPGSRRLCPECGSDLAKVGVVTPATRAPGFPFLALWLGAVALGFIAAQLGPAVAALTPWGWNFRAVHVIETTRVDRRYLTAQGLIGVEARGTGRSWGRRVNQLRVEYITPMPSDRVVRMDVAPDGQTCRIDTPGAKATSLPFDQAAVARFLSDAEFDPGAEEGRRIEVDLTQTIHHFLHAELPRGSTETAVPRTDATSYYPNEAVGRTAAVALWAVGITLLGGFLLHRYRRGRRRVAALSRELLEGLHLIAPA